MRDSYFHQIPSLKSFFTKVKNYLYDRFTASSSERLLLMIKISDHASKDRQNRCTVLEYTKSQLFFSNLSKDNMVVTNFFTTLYRSTTLQMGE